MFKASLLRDSLLTALAPLIWGSTYLVTSQCLPPDRPLTAAVIRVLPAGLLLLLYSRRLPRAGEWWHLCVLALLNIGAFQGLLFIAAYRLPGGIAALLGACQPLVLMVLVWLVERRAPGLKLVALALLGVAGMALLLDAGHRHWDLVGLAAAAGGAVLMASGIDLTRRWGSSLPVLSLTGWQLFLGGLMLLPVAALTEAALPALEAKNLAGYAYLSSFGALLAYALWFRGVARLSPVSVCALSLLSPVCAVVLGWWLGQAVVGVRFVGMMMVLGSVIAVQVAGIAASRRS